MKNQVSQKKVAELLDRFESLPAVEPSAGWYEALNRRLSATPRQRKARPALTVAIVLLVLINAAFLLKELLPDNAVITQNRRNLEVIAHDILINPDSASN